MHDDGCTARETVRSKDRKRAVATRVDVRPARSAERARYQQPSDVSRLQLRSGQYRETKPWSRGVNPTPSGTIRPFIRHPPKTDAGRFSTRAIKDIAISMWGSVEDPTFWHSLPFNEITEF